ncbi:MAG: hypothetical protein ACJA1A_003395, partial [Saprospiraceae bacterium]
FAYLFLRKVHEAIRFMQVGVARTDTKMMRRIQA